MSETRFRVTMRLAEDVSAEEREQRISEAFAVLLGIEVGGEDDRAADRGRVLGRAAAGSGG